MNESIPLATSQVVLEMARRFDIQPVVVHRADGGFSGAEVFCVIGVDGERYALRRWPVGTDRLRIDTLHRVIAALRKAGLSQIARVCQPVATQSACRFGAISPHSSTLQCDSGRLWHAETWCIGTADFHDQPTPAKAKAVGSLLARAHLALRQLDNVQLQQSHTAFQPRRGPAPSVIERAALARRWEKRVREERLHASAPIIGDQAVADVVRTIALKLPGISEDLNCEAEVVSDRLPICLRDLWSDSVLWMDGQISGLIDLSAARVDHPAGDIARLFGSLFLNHRELWDSALDEYHSILPFLPADHRLIRLYVDSEVVLSTFAWVERLFLTPQQVTSEQAAAMRSRLNHYCERVRASSHW